MDAPFLRSFLRQAIKQKQDRLATILHIRKLFGITAYASGFTSAACNPLGPSSMENSTFCSASSLR